jgi:hypothetical protein
VLIYCSGAANVTVIDNSEKIREVLAESNANKVNDEDLFS